ncbi:hypothetical protein [Leptolyngbya sp. NIES-2104]|uniref:hypothetical protein n=1 Tax=Leptolyngbya sp. NIES-2104 TaxID=1552121 RepID=UPI0006EC94B6|nr:hypothetical protein [Leptolyngbya sp. NIES-2104]GAQ00072.1 hypothetical protein NIES2104_66370 [Leptolyngbya sp. NIES-2104]
MAINWDNLKQRYLQSGRASQLESIVLNLARIQTLANSGEDGQVARHLVRESQFLIEWTVPTIDLETDLPIATALVDLQRQLSEWKLDWDGLWENASARSSLVMQAQQWCDRLQTCVMP